MPGLLLVVAVVAMVGLILLRGGHVAGRHGPGEVSVAQTDQQAPGEHRPRAGFDHG